MADEPAGPIRRRRRRKATRAQGAPPAGSAASAPPASAPAASAPAAFAPAPQAAGPRKRRVPRDGGERGLRDIVGAGQSQVGTSGALRARDLNRPSADDLAEAEQNLVIVRRNWRPDDTAPRARQ